MRAIMFGILAHIAYALAVFIMGRKLAAVNPFLLNLLVAGIGTVLLLPALWRNPSLPIFTDTRLLGWIALASFLMIALGETFCMLLGFRLVKELATSGLSRLLPFSFLSFLLV